LGGGGGGGGGQSAVGGGGGGGGGGGPQPPWGCPVPPANGPRPGDSRSLIHGTAGLPSGSGARSAVRLGMVVMSPARCTTCLPEAGSPDRARTSRPGGYVDGHDHRPGRRPPQTTPPPHQPNHHPPPTTQGGVVGGGLVVGGVGGAFLVRSRTGRVDGRRPRRNWEASRRAFRRDRSSFLEWVVFGGGG